MIQIFNIKDFDGHYILTILGIKVAIKHPSTFKYKPATEYGITVERRTPQYIVSLTSFPARINTAHLAINTLLQQTFKPDRIILWLASEQFAKKEKDFAKADAIRNELLENGIVLEDPRQGVKWKRA